MTIMKMNNKVRKIVGVIVILIGIMMSVKSAAYAADREPMKDYERVLISEGFVQDENDEAIWYFDDVRDGVQCKAFYDGYYDSGCVYAYDLNTGEKALYVFKWQPSELEFEIIADYDF